MGEKGLAFTHETLSNMCTKVQVVHFLLHLFALSFVFSFSFSLVEVCIFCLLHDISKWGTLSVLELCNCLGLLRAKDIWAEKIIKVKMLRFINTTDFWS